MSMIRKYAIKLSRYFPSGVKKIIYRMFGANIGKRVHLGFGSVILSGNIRIGDDVKISRNSSMKCFEIRIGSSTVIGPDSEFCVPGNIEIGSNSTFGRKTTAFCRGLTIGDYMYSGDEVNFGYSSPTPDSLITIGQHCFIGSKTIINSEKPVRIGDDVGIGSEVMIWTHGSWLPVLEGFPSNVAPVKIGSRVWLPSRCIVLPGADIGNDCVISINSVVTRSIPSGSLVSGNPAKVIKENMYPKKLEPQKKASIVAAIIESYIPMLEDKGFVPIKKETGPDFNRQEEFDGLVIAFFADLTDAALKDIIAKKKRAIILFLSTKIRVPEENAGNITYFDLASLRILGMQDDRSEDLRDHLRRRGIKIFTGRRFVSIKPTKLKQLEGMS